MRNRSFGLLVVAIAFSSAVGLTVSSCDSNSSNPATPGNGGAGHGKSPVALDGNCPSVVGASFCGNGNTSARYDDNNDLNISGLNGAAADNVAATFDSPVNNFRADIDASLPAGNGALSFSAQDAGGNEQARLDLQAQGTGFSIFPTFTSNANGGAPQYDAIVYNGATQTGSQVAIPAGQTITISSDDPDCAVAIKKFGWNAKAFNAQCVLNAVLNPCCVYTFRFPDGTTYTGNAIKFIERNSNAVYVYVQTSRVVIGGTTTTGTATISQSAAYSAN